MSNLVGALWESRESRAALWRNIALVLAVVAVAQVGLCWRLLRRPREVVRIGCDGIPHLVRVDYMSYVEPNEIELQAFIRNWTVFYARYDSFSITNDCAWVGRWMVPELLRSYQARMVQGVGGEEPLIRKVQAAARRAEIDPNKLRVTIDKTLYPWRAEVRGARQVLGSATPQLFGVDLEIVRASREEVLEGLLVQSVKDVSVVAEEGTKP